MNKILKRFKGLKVELRDIHGNLIEIGKLKREKYTFQFSVKNFGFNSDDVSEIMVKMNEDKMVFIKINIYLG